MKKTGILLLLTFLFSFGSFSFAENALNFGELLNLYFSSSLNENIPASSQYIKLNYPDLAPADELYPLLQKAVYVEKFPNTKAPLNLSKSTTTDDLALLIRYNFGEKLNLPSQPLTLQTFLSTYKTFIESYQQKNLAQTAILAEITKTLNEYYLYTDKLDQEKMNYAAIKAYVAALEDPNTSYMPPAEAQSFMEGVNGELTGIGVGLKMNDRGEVEIQKVYPNSPAEEAGLQKGDIIIQIGDEKIESGSDLNAVATLIKGPENTKVTLTFQRGTQKFTKTITRKHIELAPIEYEKKGNGTCYIRISSFDLKVSEKFEKALVALPPQQCGKYIFDLRDNPGGIMEEAETMISYFLPTGTALLSFEERQGKVTKYASETAFKIFGKELIILVNENSASAAEVFTFILKEYLPQTLIIGSQTFGKGSMQQTKTFADNSLLKYTMAEWKSGRDNLSIHKVGITPDVLLIDDANTQEDEILNYAIK